MHPQGLWRDPKPACYYYHVAWDLPEFAAELAAGGGDDPRQPPAAPRLGLEVALRVMVRPLPGPVWSLRPILRRGSPSDSAAACPAACRPGTRSGWQPSESARVASLGGGFPRGPGPARPEESGLGLSGASGFKIVFEVHAGFAAFLSSLGPSAASQRLAKNGERSGDRRDLTALRRSSFAVCVHQ
jgi:hypothetical protein